MLLSPDPWVLGFGSLAGGRLYWAALLVGAELLALVVCRRPVRDALSSVDSVAPRRSLFAGAIAVHVLLATAVSARPAAYPLRVGLMGVIVALSWLTLGAAATDARALGMDRWIDRVLSSGRTRWWLAGGAVAATVAMSRTIFHGIPHVPDEVVYLLQAQYLADGKLYLAGIPSRALDVISTSTHQGHWFGIFPVGWPAILAVGVALGAPSLVNPVLTGVAVLVGHGVARRLWDLRTANLAAFLLATSPWLLFLGSSYMSHVAAILAGMLAMRGSFEVSEDSQPRRWSLLGGSALGVLVLIRPFEGVLLGLACAGIYVVRRRAVVPTPQAAVFAIVAIGVGGLTLPYNHALTGHALVDPITQYFDRMFYPGANRLGFGADVGNVGWENDALPGHSPLEALINTSWNASLVQLELFGWGFGSLAIVLLAVAAGAGAFDGAMIGALSVAVLVWAGYCLYWYSAADFGPRYWSQMIMPLAALTAAALARLSSGGFLKRLVVLASLLGAPVVIVMRGTIKYHDYRGMTPYMEHLAREQGFGHDLILIRGDVFSDYSPGLILNPPGLDGSGPLYFRWVDGEDLAALRDRFPGRRLWIVDGPSITGGRPSVASGPIP